MVTDVTIARAGVVALDDPEATERTVVGAKAAALAVASRAGMPVLEGLVLTTTFASEIDGGAHVDTHAAIETVSDHFRGRPLVVRSSSTAEDLADSSMAGRFGTVVGVRGRDQLVDAVRTVLDSRRAAAEGDSGLKPDHPMAVLVQPFLDAQLGGVLFGVDPVTGRSDRLVVVAADDPDQVVSGEVAGIRNELDHAGARTDDGADEDLGRGLRRSLAALAAEAAEIFDGPQDIEWLLDEGGDVCLLQSRPVTTTIRGIPEGPLYGPGPVAETFPDPLSRLERDLWVPPLRHAMREALILAGAARREQVEARPIIVSPGGRVAVDLEITGEVSQSDHPMLARFDPRRIFSRLGSAWRIGRLRAALPDLALDTIDRADTELRGVVSLAALSDRQLVALLDRARRALMSLHAHEILMGLLVDPDEPELTGASVAMRVVAQARRDGRSDEEIVSDNPVVLALVAPRIGGPISLPDPPRDLPPDRRPRRSVGTAGVRREALRLRVRWIQELTGRAAWQIGVRMTDTGHLEEPEQIRDLRLEEMRAVFLGWNAEPELDPLPPDVDPLPGTFQLSDLGMPIRVRRAGVTDEAVGAGGGRGQGPVTHEADPPEGSVLVVASLRPDLAPVLGRLAGLVSETGSPLAHLAILAREAGVPTVVGVDDAPNRFEDGTVLDIDGNTGRIVVVDPDEGTEP